MIGRSSPSNLPSNFYEKWSICLFFFPAVFPLARSYDSDSIMRHLSTDVLNDVKSFYDDFQETADIIF